MKIAFFDSKPYLRKIFEEVNNKKHTLRFFQLKLTTETIDLAKGFECVCAFVNDCLDESIIQSLNQMDVSLVAMRCKGYDNLDLNACRKYGIDAVYVPNYSPYSVAEHTVALMLTLNRRIHKAYNRIREGNFSLDGLEGFDMHGKTVGVIGAGDIGKSVINIMIGFGCKVLVYDLLNKAKEFTNFSKDQLMFTDLDYLYANSNIITLHVPLTQANTHMINADSIAKMKPGVMLINTSRGGLIDTESLIEGIKSKKISHVGLDVYEKEGRYFFEDFSNSVIADDNLARLMTFPNTIITSHQAFLTHEALTDIATTTLQSVDEFEQGKRGKQLSFSLITE